MSSKKNRNRQHAPITTNVEVQTPLAEVTETPVTEQLTAVQPSDDTNLNAQVQTETPPVVNTPVEVVVLPAAADNAIEPPVEPPVTTATVEGIEQPIVETPPTDQVEQPSAQPTEAPQEKKPATPAKVKRGVINNDLSALDAAAKVLARKQEPMSCKELIGLMALRGLWTSPKGATPHATLYAAMTREITTKGKWSRFRKVGRGLFAINSKVEDATTPKGGKAKNEHVDEVEPSTQQPSIPDGTESPESLKELFRI